MAWVVAYVVNLSLAPARLAEQHEYCFGICRPTLYFEGYLLHVYPNIPAYISPPSLSSQLLCVCFNVTHVPGHLPQFIYTHVVSVQLLLYSDELLMQEAKPGVTHRCELYYPPP